MNPPQHRRADYAHFQPITTRWHDNDVYGHVNNVVYYGFFDSAVNTYLIEVGGLDIHEGEVIGFVVSSSCDYFASIAFPERIEVGLRVGKLGNSSVQYELAIFRAGEEQACAAGRFVHVFVDRASNRPVPIPENLRQALARLGVVFQQSTLDLDLTVEQNLRYHAALHGMPRALANERIELELQRQQLGERRRAGDLPVLHRGGGHRLPVVQRLRGGQGGVRHHAEDA